MIWTKPIQTKKTFKPTELNTKKKFPTKKSVLCYCNSKWLQTSTLGMLIYLFSVCLNYIIGYTMYYTLKLGWSQPIHSNVCISGDLVTFEWFALVFIALPWHAWEDLTCIGHSKTRRCFSRCFNSKKEETGKLPERSYCMGWVCYISWMLGTWVSLFAYGHMRNIEVFQTSLNTPNMTAAQKSAQKSVYGVTFSVVVAIIVYWCCKLCPCKSVRKCCDDKSLYTSFQLQNDENSGIINEIDVENIKKKQEKYAKRKIVFVRLFLFTTLIFVLSWIICNSEQCDYHLHHWWFGVVLILLSTATLDNWFDYFLQGVFWTFLLESIFNYTIIFGHFFI